MDEHEASRRLGLTFPVLVRHPDKRPVFQSHRHAPSSRHRRYQVCRRFASWTSDRPLCALGWPCAIRRSGQRWLRSPFILTATSLYLCAGLSLSLVRDATRLRCQQVACAPSAHAHVILELRRVATTEHPTCNHRVRRRAEADLRSSYIREHRRSVRGELGVTISPARNACDDVVNLATAPVPQGS